MEMSETLVELDLPPLEEPLIEMLDELSMFWTLFICIFTLS